MRGWVGIRITKRVLFVCIYLVCDYATVSQEQISLNNQSNGF